MNTIPLTPIDIKWIKEYITYDNVNSRDIHGNIIIYYIAACTHLSKESNSEKLEIIK